MHDRYTTFATGLESPVVDAFPISPDDHADLPEVTRALYVGAAGTITLTLASGTAITLSGVNGGAILPLRATRVHATATTASDIVGFV